MSRSPALLQQCRFINKCVAAFRFEQKEQLGVVESVKAASDVYSPISGEILEVKTLLLA